MKQPLMRMTEMAAYNENDLPEEIPPEVQHDGNWDSYGQKDQDKMANSKRRKRTRKKDVDIGNDSSVAEDDDRSHVLFCDDSILKKKKKNTKERKSVKIRQKQNQKVNTELPETQAQHVSDTSIVSESQENPDFVIEDTNGQIYKRKMVHLQQGSNQSELDNHSTDSQNAGSENVDDVHSGQHSTDIPSVEIPRDAKQHSALCLGSFTQSPICLMESSDEVSLIDSGRGRKCHYGTISASRHGDSSASSETGSDYTYSYVSTYTDATGTVSTKTMTASPPVRMKVCPNLNSTVCRGKDCIGDIEFPQSISPVVKHRVQTKLPPGQCVQQEFTFRSDSMDSVRNKDKMKVHNPKCSTMLFGSENPCSLPVISDNLTTIHSEDMGSETQTDFSDRQSSIPHSLPQILATHEDVFSRQHGPKEFDESKQRSAVKASTPHGFAKQFSLDMSPIEHKTMDQEELQVHSSILARSDLVFLPSPAEPNSPDRLITEHKKDTSAVNLHRHHSTEIFHGTQSRQDGPAHPHSYSKHSSNTDKALHEEPRPRSVAMSVSSTNKRKAAETPGKEDIRPQAEMLAYSAGRKIQAKISSTKNKSPCTPLNGNTLEREAHIKTSGVANKREAAETPGKEDIRPQAEMLAYSAGRKMQAKISSTKKKSPCTPLNGNTFEREAHIKTPGVANKHKVSTVQSFESHCQIINTPVTHKQQHIQQVNSIPDDINGNLSQQALHCSTKREYKKRSSKRHNLQFASTVCYINRLCRASQEYFRTEAHRLHQ